MKAIQLTQGKVALVDDADYEWLSQHKWCAHKKGRIFYAVRNTPLVNGKHISIRMHREILGEIPKGLFSDHINGDGLDNRRKNLRLVTHAENNRNSRKRPGVSSRFKGVYWRSTRCIWRAQIMLPDPAGIGRGRQISLGDFAVEEDAARAYDDAAKKHHGEFAKLNFPI